MGPGEVEGTSQLGRLSQGTAVPSAVILARFTGPPSLSLDRPDRKPNNGVLDREWRNRRGVERLNCFLFTFYKQ